MAPSKFSLGLTLAILSIWAVDAADQQAAAPTPSSFSVECTSLILKMSDCFPFVASGSQVSEPKDSCCSGLKTVLKEDPKCLCEALKSSGSMAVSINVTKALTLPAACKVSAPSATNCGTAVSPAGAPGVQPSATAAGAPSASSEGAKETTPATGSSGTPSASSEGAKEVTPDIGSSDTPSASSGAAKDMTPVPDSSGSPVLSVSIGSLVAGLMIMLISGY
ncbi:Plant lipid transfer protein/Par allergen [Corchorus olitorius]|uniref:Plant lipid transfer protein/Par allergen n=1 Tax=Corchorus olitorius TaxID=93759 RepID=A0A1R3GQM9_9ROSI|nr:Plant lipid transfer protein/Par allergen [Corchorus olitorius]